MANIESQQFRRPFACFAAFVLQGSQVQSLSRPPLFSGYLQRSSTRTNERVGTMLDQKFPALKAASLHNTRLTLVARAGNY